MGQGATAELIADFLLRYYREPMRYRARAPRATHLYGNLDSVLRLALGRAVEFSDPALRGPAAAAELERAAVFYIQQQFFRDDATHYEVLGLAGDASAEAVRENFRLLMQLIHPDRQGADTIWAESYAARANRAHAVLKSAGSRSDYDRELAAARARDTTPKPATIVAGPRGPARIVPSPRRRVPVSVLPEWWTAGVGGFVRDHPGFAAFAVLVGVSVLVILMVIGPEREGVLGAEAGYSTRPPLRTVEVAPAERGAPVVVAAPPPASAVLPADVVPPVRVVPAGARGSVDAVAAPVKVAVPPVPPAAPPAPVQPSRASPPPAEVQMANPAPALVPAALAAAPPPGERTAVAMVPPLGSSEVEVLIAAFVSSYEKGRLDTFAKLFDDDAQTNQNRGRAAIASEYDQLFRSTVWRRMAISQLGWKPVGDHTEAKGEFVVKTGWRDGREVEQRMAVDMELVRQGGRAVIAKLSLQPR